MKSKSLMLMAMMMANHALGLEEESTSSLRGMVLEATKDDPNLASIVDRTADEAGDKLKDKAKELTSESKEIGETCVVGTECKNYGLPLMSGTDCCNFKCTEKVKDYASTYWCPQVAVVKLKAEGESCSLGTQCEGYTFLGEGMECCWFRCQRRKQGLWGAWLC